MMLKRVDLPQPEGPITDTNSPWRTSKETLSRANTGPSDVVKRLETPSTASSGAAMICPAWS